MVKTKKNDGDKKMVKTKKMMRTKMETKMVKTKKW